MTEGSGARSVVVTNGSGYECRGGPKAYGSYESGSGCEYGRPTMTGAYNILSFLKVIGLRVKSFKGQSSQSRMPESNMVELPSKSPCSS
jgi:hypothetical protein